MLGLGLRAWAAGHLAKDQQLATGGPFAYVRNPLYAGTLIAALGIMIASRSAVLGLVFALVFVLAYLPAIELEEQHLGEIFPKYAEYAAAVRRFLPSGKWAGTGGRFSWPQYRRNEEYKALIGFAAAAAWLFWKYWRAKAV